MYELIETQLALPGVSILIGASQWVTPEDWVCPADNYVVCQRISDGHSALRMKAGDLAVHEVYSHVRSVGFMPSTGCVKRHKRPRGGQAFRNRLTDAARSAGDERDLALEDACHLPVPY